MVATKRRFNPNLQRVRLLLQGKATRAYVCTRCLKAGKVTESRLGRNRPLDRNRLESRRGAGAPTPVGRARPDRDRARGRSPRSWATPRPSATASSAWPARAGSRGLLTRDKLTQGIEVDGTGDGLVVDLHVVVEYGLNLAEVAATVRSRVAYEVERLTGLTVAAVEVHIEDVRRSA